MGGTGMIGLNSAIRFGNSSIAFSCPNQSCSVFKYFTLSFASCRALKTSLHNFAKGVQYVDLFASKNRSTCTKTASLASYFIWNENITTTGVRGRGAPRERERERKLPCGCARPVAAQKSN